MDTMRIDEFADQSGTDPLSLSRDLGRYLGARMELGPPEVVFPPRGREYEAVSVGITATNTAPDEPGGPRVVLIGVGLQVTYLKGRGTGPARWRRELKRHPPEPPPRRGRLARPSPHALTSGGSTLKITPAERQMGDVLFPGQSIGYELKVPSPDIPYLEFHVEATVSTRHLFHYERLLSMPAAYMRPHLLSALRALNAIGLHRPLEETLDSLPDLGPDMRLREIQAFSSVLSSIVPRIQADQEAVEVVIREAPTTRFRQHLADTHHHLTRVHDACERMMEVISTGNPEEIAGAGRALQELRLEAEQLSQATEEIMHSHSIAPEEADQDYRGQ